MKPCVSPSNLVSNLPSPKTREISPGHDSGLLRIPNVEEVIIHQKGIQDFTRTILFTNNLEQTFLPFICLQQWRGLSQDYSKSPTWWCLRTETYLPFLCLAITDSPEWMTEKSRCFPWQKKAKRTVTFSPFCTFSQTRPNYIRPCPHYSDFVWKWNLNIKNAFFFFVHTRIRIDQAK